MKAYHCSPSSNEESIEREGLKPYWDWDNSRGEANRSWHHYPVHLSEDHPYDSFISNLYCDADNDFAPIEVTIYEVNVEYLTVKTGYDGPGSLAVHEWIEPNRLTKIGRTIDGKRVEVAANAS